MGSRHVYEARKRQPDTPTAPQAAAASVPQPLSRRGRITPVPSFRPYAAASGASARSKRANRSIDTKPELLLRSALLKLGLRFRMNDRTIAGRPDFILEGDRVAIFCDGDFWHGRHWRRLKEDLSHRANAMYWIEKIGYNRARDRRNTRLLTNAGWMVIRVWETDVRRDATAAAMKIASAAQPTHTNQSF